jgi:hypothetical protein
MGCIHDHGFESENTGRPCTKTVGLLVKGASWGASVAVGKYSEALLVDAQPDAKEWL